MRVKTNIKITGTQSHPVTAFDGFTDLDGKIAFVVPVLSACNVSSNGVYVNWNMYGGRCEIDVITPISQDVYFNLAVFHMA